MLINTRVHQVRRVVAPNPKTRVVGWVEFAADSIPEKAFLRYRMPLVRPKPEK
ncbi:MAG: hypothetical protein K2W96_24095 [Gemmataceae bacterium]|nr:hypothetical protein [Gemmataceae bacterium]